MIREKIVISERYKLASIINIDKHSAIFLAKDQQNDDTKVVLKILRERLVIPEVVEQFVDVANKVKSANSDSLIKILDIGGI